jgi:hypothetical protein
MFADAVIKAKNEQGPWQVMDLIVQHWMESNPRKYNSFIMQTEETRNTRRNVYGSNKAKTMRLKVSVPEDVINRFRKIYHADEFSFDKDFLNKLWERYPTFRVAERN